MKGVSATPDRQVGTGCTALLGAFKGVHMEDSLLAHECTYLKGEQNK